MKILILGSSGKLGSELFNTLKKNKFNVFNSGIKKRNSNLTSLINLEKIISKRNYDVIVNCLSYPNIDLCEKNKKKAKLINFNIVDNLILLKKKLNLNYKLIQISTDHLYDSKFRIKNNEKSQIKINNYYAYTKYLAEKIALKNKEIVLRTNFFGELKNKKKTFSSWVIDSFQNKKKFYLANDVFFSPLSLSTLTMIISKIIKNHNKLHGLYNLGSKGIISKKDFAILFARKLNIYNQNYEIKNINKITKVKRSKNMVMDSSKLEKKLKININLIENEIYKEANRVQNEN